MLTGKSDLIWVSVLSALCWGLLAKLFLIFAFPAIEVVAGHYYYQFCPLVAPHPRNERENMKRRVGYGEYAKYTY